MMDIAEFLLSRIAEDEAVAREAGEYDSADWFADGGSLGPGKEPGWHSFEYIGGENARHAARWDPARVLTECGAKRRIVELHQAQPLPVGAWRPGELVCGEDDNWWPCETLQLLALPYADHPDYDEEWRLVPVS